MLFCICGHSKATHHPDACGFMCAICNGKFILAEERDCSWCHGTGKRTILLGAAPYTCPDCQGKGRINKP